MYRLKELREQRGLSCRKLAEAINVSHTKINKIERGEQKMTAPTAIALADYFGVSVDYIMGYSAEEIFTKFVSTYSHSFEDFHVDKNGTPSGGYRGISVEMSIKIGILQYLAYNNNLSELTQIFELCGKLAKDRNQK